MRPRFHFTSNSGWINDPHGITYRADGYHLFYQYVPDSVVWALDCHWGHATSPDLFTFEQMPVALYPGDGDDGVWTGSVVTGDDGCGVIFYTSVAKAESGIGTVRVATPTDSAWTKWQKGTVVAEAPPGLGLTAFRDPFVFRDGDGWRMYVGASLAGDTAAILSYGSADLSSWTYAGIAAQRSTRELGGSWSGSLWECPQLFEIDGRHVLVTAVWHERVLHHVAYAVGDYHQGRFEASTWSRLSYGDSYYAPTFFRDSVGRPTLMFWLRHMSDPAAGWAGAHSVPHTLRLDGDMLVASPHPGIEAYRTMDGSAEGSAVDVLWSPGNQLILRSGENVVAQLEIRHDVLTLVVEGASWPMPYSGGDIRVIIDAPVLEVSTRDGVVAAPITSTARGFAVEADGDLRVFGLRR